ncbi:MAG: DUF692 domain-containing protein [Robiginitomaculum sp.]|nr:DUF692 domain-containing protein [Robiginitomaculum sp.]MDQ7076528.1 DUF692 domain-containing protein [Robiginitomaculum sp.]
MTKHHTLPDRAGLGLKPEHYREALATSTNGLWFEVHPENYMVEGGPRLAWLDAIADRFALSLHGVGLSLGGPDRPDRNHLARLKALVDRYNPASVSEHVAWSRLGNTYFADLLPPPPTRQTLNALAAHIAETQDMLGRQILIENPALYISLQGDISMMELYVEAAKIAGAGLLFDLNNIYVCAQNLGGSPRDWLDVVPPEEVGEVHLAGFTVQERNGDQVLIDSHGAPISGAVWALYEDFIRAAGPRPTLIERDENIPAFAALMAEAHQANLVLDEAGLEAGHG